MRRVLVFSRTTGFRHDSIPAGIAAVEAIGAQHGLAVDATEDPSCFTDQGLTDYDLVVWLQVSGTVLDDAQRAAYERFTAAGGGFVGIHAAADAERDWLLYDALVGARFQSHPPGMHSARVWMQEDQSTRDLPNPWTWRDEWYTFDRNPRPDVEVLATVDESDYQPGDHAMGTDHPVCWRRRVGPAMAWYTALGHSPEMFEDELFRHHLAGGICDVARVGAVRAGGPQ